MNQMPAEKLYFSTTSPYARKVRIAAAEKGVPFEAVLDVPWNEDTRTIALNPLGKVPVWVMADGTALFDSRVIVEYVDSRSEENPLLPRAIKERIIVRRWEAMADGVMDASLAIFSERRKRPEELQYPAWSERQFGKIHRALQALNDELGARDFYHGDRLGVAEIGVASALGYVGLRFSDDFRWQDKYPKLAALYGRLMQREAFSTTVPVL